MKIRSTRLLAVALAVALAAALFTLQTPANADPVAPANYSVTRIAAGASSLGPITGLTELPGGGILMGHQRGQIRHYNPTNGAVTTWAEVPIAVGTDGAIGVSGLLDVLYMAPAAGNAAVVVVSFTCRSGNAVVHCLRVFDTSGSPLLTNKYGDPLFRWENGGSHNGGGLAHDARKLYVGTGDDTHSDDVGQNPASLKAKILAFDRSALGGDPVVVAMGIRQPFGMFMHGTEIIEFDVGKTSWEEINRITPNAANPPNFGWKGAGDGDASAWLKYPHNGDVEPWGYAIIGGGVWNDLLYFADHPRGVIYSVDLDTPSSVKVFSTNWDFPTNLLPLSNGNLAVATRSNGLWEISQTGAPPSSVPDTTVPDPPPGDSGLTFTPTPRVDFTFNEPTRWQIDLAHDDSTDGTGYHTHPQIPETASDSGSFSIERPVGHEDSNVWWEVTATTDSGAVKRWRVDPVTLVWSVLEGDDDPPPPPVVVDQVTFIANSSPAPSKDLAFVSRLRDNGYTVTVVDDDDVTDTDLTGSVVVLSTSVVPSKVQELVASMDEPLVTWEVYVAKQAGLATGPNYKSGERSIATSDVTIVGSHPVTAGLPDSTTIFTTSKPSWNRIDPSAVAADARVLASNGQAVVVANDSRRSVMLPWTWNSSDQLTPSAFRLFDQAVTWAGG